MTADPASTDREALRAQLAQLPPNASPRQMLDVLEQMPLDMELAPGVTVQDQIGWFSPLAAPPPAPAGFQWRPDVVYGTAGAGGRDLTLHLYAGQSGEKRPGIVFIHGGGWQGGHPYILVRLAAEMAAKGYVTSTISYRLSGEAAWPAALEDSKCAVRWMRAHAAGIGLDPDRIAVAGGSAGGHLAAMVALAPGRFEGSGGWDTVSSQVQAAVLYNPAVDLREAVFSDEQIREMVRAFLPDDEQTAADASPIAQVSSVSPPILSRVGDQDDITPASTCQEFHQALDAAGVPNHLEIIAGKTHGLPLHDHAGCLEATKWFLAKHLGPAVPG